MQLTPEAIQEFKRAFELDFPGQEISSEEAEAMGQRLILLFSVIYQPIPKNDHK
ncbi:MAG: hypothetical protein NTZ25_01195 [Candidatus Peregrinibacteria bacterium]|nr:hypothetical protein [Candidatus Peregrinibacteria bacterium]